jgi:hypothetical protein
VDCVLIGIVIGCLLGWCCTVYYLSRRRCIGLDYRRHNCNAAHACCCALFTFICLRGERVVRGGRVPGVDIMGMRLRKILITHFVVSEFDLDNDK